MLASPKLDYYNGDTQSQTVRVGDTLEVKLDVRADSVALQQILLALDTIANLPDDVPGSSFEQEIVAKARDILNKRSARTHRRTIPTCRHCAVM